MNCIEFSSALEFSIETRTLLDSAAIEHTAGCDECRIEWQIDQQLNAVIAVWRPVTGSSGLADRVMADLTPGKLLTSDDPQSITVSGSTLITQKPAPRRQFGVLVSAVACLFVVVVFSSRFSGRNSRELTSRLSTKAQESIVDQSPLDVSQTLSEVISDLRSEYQIMASETKSAAMDLVSVLPHDINVSLQPVSDEIVTRPLTSDMSRAWRPISDRVETALGFLWQAVPNKVPSG